MNRFQPTKKRRCNWPESEHHALGETDPSRLEERCPDHTRQDHATKRALAVIDPVDEKPHEDCADHPWDKVSENNKQVQ